ncbi:hypothetical protein, partial [Serratia marcescens]|uniref:hypothetical protein n=2 Tax=Serratia TaxID=613 RepID=UPI00235E6F43
PDDKAETVTLKVTPSFPVELTPGERFALRPRGRWLTWPTAADLTTNALKNLPDVVVEVVKAEPLLGRVTVRWIAASVPTITAGPPLTVSPVRLNGVTPNTSYQWGKLTDHETPYAWAMPYTHDSFAFTLSIVLNRAWLKDSQNPEALSQWIQDIVREEMPSHLKLQL